MKKKVLIIGILGQDGTILSSMIKDNYDLFGICKPNTDKIKIEEFKNQINSKIYLSDFTKYENVKLILSTISPDIIINFAGITNVFNPWENNDLIFEQNCVLPINVLNYIKNENPSIFFFQSSSSLMYGNSKIKSINELSNFAPMYPYGISKLYTHNYINEYRRNFGLKCSSGIFFNHESYYRNSGFLSKKVSSFVSKILKGESGKLKLGNLESYKDISHAFDFMLGVKMIIDSEINEDFIFSSNSLIKIFNFVNLFFSLHNLNIDEYVDYDSGLNRNEDISIFGDNRKLKSIGWNPKYSIEDLILDMVKLEIF